MKVRIGFVSNSSTSSFLIYFEKKPSRRSVKRDLIYEARSNFVFKDLEKN
jgi:hypothetical protein